MSDTLLDYARGIEAVITPLVGLTLYTAQMAVKCDPSYLVIDTIVKSSQPPWDAFKPTWDIVMGHKSGKLSDARYIRTYYALMKDSLEKNRPTFNRVIYSHVPVVLKCYCQPGKFCHRHLLVKLFEKMCEKQEIPFQYLGELR